MKEQKTAYDKNPWPVVVGLILTIIGWIGIFIPIDLEEDELQLQCYILMGVAAAGCALCALCIKRAPSMGLIGILSGATLLLTLILAAIGSF